MPADGYYYCLFIHVGNTGSSRRNYECTIEYCPDPASMVFTYEQHHTPLLCEAILEFTGTIILCTIVPGTYRTSTTSLLSNCSPKFFLKSVVVLTFVVVEPHIFYHNKGNLMKNFFYKKAAVLIRLLYRGKQHLIRMSSKKFRVLNKILQEQISDFYEKENQYK